MIRWSGHCQHVSEDTDFSHRGGRKAAPPLRCCCKSLSRTAMFTAPKKDTEYFVVPVQLPELSCPKHQSIRHPARTTRRHRIPEYPPDQVA